MTKKIMWLGVALSVLALVAWSAWQFLQRGNAPSTLTGNLTIHDAQDRDVVVQIPTKRIVTLTNADTEVLLALGEKPLATVANFNSSDETKKKLEGVPQVGAVTAPDLEAIIQVKPDIVIAGPVPFQTALAPGFEKAGIPIVFLKANTYRDILDRIELLGRLSGKSDAAQKWVTDIDHRVQQIRASYAQQPRKKIAIIWGTTAGFHLASSHTFVGDLVAQVPVDNIADGMGDKLAEKGLGAGYVALDMEYLAKENPDVLLVVAHGVSRENAKTFLSAFENQASWQGLRAVREGHMYYLPSDLFAANPTVRAADSVAYVGRLLYGEEK